MEAALTGWMSQLSVAAQTHRRVVLHGNVFDRVLPVGTAAAAPQPFVAWLYEFLLAAGYERVIDFDYVHAPTQLGTQDIEELEQAALNPNLFNNPTAPLQLIADILANPDYANTAVIVRGADLAANRPDRSYAMLHSLSRTSRETIEHRCLEIHLYARDSEIPPDFVRSDPDTRLILVPPPRLYERLLYLRAQPSSSHLLNAREGEKPVSHERLARVTEGFRLREIEQLVALADSMPPDQQLDELVRLFRFGRSHDYWADKNVDDIVEHVQKFVFGQDRAIGQICTSLYIAKHHVIQMVDSARSPAMVLFFVGASGVGKTLMARTLCEAITGNPENLRIFDMSEFQQDHSDQRLIGSPPGYVGFGEGGQLTNWIAERPQSVVLFDEVEKAHERIIDMFLQILDGARLTDGKGSTVDFSETILIFTSNIGAEEAHEQVGGKTSPAAVAEYFMEQVREYFHEELGRPELFGRFRKGGIIPFDFITEENARSCIQRKLMDLAEAIASRLLALGSDAGFEAGPNLGEIVDQIMVKCEYDRYGLREVNNQLVQLSGLGVGVFLDQARQRTGTHSFYWDKDEGRIRIGFDT